MCERERPVFATGTILNVTQRQPNVYQIMVSCDTDMSGPFDPGQFFMLRKKGSHQLLGRPISIFQYYMSVTAGTIGTVEFLIQEKGGGTKELTSVERGAVVELLGPLGNRFPLPSPSDRACLISGGVGFAPIYCLAARMCEMEIFSDSTCYNCFRDSFDFEFLHRYGGLVPMGIIDEHTQVVTESGKQGIKGMLPDVLDAKKLKEEGYTVVYACGPTPMLKYVQSICKEAGVKSYLSVENRMACGVGACLGCTIKTTEGNKRCCKDGPVFPGEILIFDDESPKRNTQKGTEEKLTEDSPVEADIDTSVKIAGVEFRNPVIAASGTFGYGIEYKGLVNLDSLGGICSKGLTLEPRTGNNGNRIHELTSVGLMNSIGLENPGIESFIEHKLPQMLALDTVTIANLSGSSADTYIRGAMLLDKTDVNMIELNISCPNVKAGGMAFGMTPEDAGSITKQVRNVTAKPLIVKLTPNAPDLVGVALAVKRAGADAISLVNTFQALAIDIEAGKPVFDNVCAGYSGPGIKPIALRMVRDVAKAIHAQDPDYPIIGLGGISTWQDAIEFIMAGATAIQVGTATFANPNAMNEIIQGIEGYMKEKGFTSLADFRGII